MASDCQCCSNITISWKEDIALRSADLMYVQFTSCVQEVKCNTNSSLFAQNWIVDTQAATGSVLSKKVFLQILQNSQENTYARVSLFNKVAVLKLNCWKSKKIHNNTIDIFRQFHTLWVYMRKIQAHDP